MKPQRPGIGARIGVGLLLGVVLGWASIFLIPTIQRLGVPERAAQNLPIAAFVVGLGLVIATRRSKNASELLGAVFLPFILGGAFWLLFGLPIGALMVAFLGASDDAASWAALVAFGLGFTLGAVAFVLGAAGVLLDWIRKPGGSAPK
jgi:hypothetical protein